MTAFDGLKSRLQVSTGVTDPGTPGQAKLPDPAVVPNAGSFFKNPVIAQDVFEHLEELFPNIVSFPDKKGFVKLSAGWLIEHCGWKGRQRDGVGVHPNHALVLVNYDQRSGKTLLALARDIAADVKNAFGVQLEIEPRIYGL